MNFTPRLHLTGDAVVDDLLSSDPNALLIGMVLDQQVPMEKAFSGPAVIAVRLGGELDVVRIADMSEDEFVALCAERPAVHRFPAAMGKRVQQVCRVLVDQYAGDAAGLWRDAATGADVKRAVQSLPGFGPQKAAIFTALLGKQYGLTAAGWREAAGEFGQDGYRSVADIVDADSLAKVRATKQEVKRAAKQLSAKP